MIDIHKDYHKVKKILSTYCFIRLRLNKGVTTKICIYLDSTNKRLATIENKWNGRRDFRLYLGAFDWMDLWHLLKGIFLRSCFSRTMQGKLHLFSLCVIVMRRVGSLKNVLPKLLFFSDNTGQLLGKGLPEILRDSSLEHIYLVK